MLGPCGKHPSARADGLPKEKQSYCKSIALTSLIQKARCSTAHCADMIRFPGQAHDSGWRRTTRVLVMSASGGLTREVDGAGDVEGAGTWLETEELPVSTISPR